MAVVTLTERALDGIDAAFALEWEILPFVALAAFGLLARINVPGDTGQDDLVRGLRAAWRADPRRCAAGSGASRPSAC